MNDNLGDKLKELKQGYLKKLEITLCTFKNLLTDFESINIDELYSMVHTISGTSGMYGLNSLSDASTEFELYLKEIKNDKNLLKEDELLEKFKKYVNTIEKNIGEQNA